VILAIDMYKIIDEDYDEDYDNPCKKLIIDLIKFIMLITAFALTNYVGNSDIIYITWLCVIILYCLANGFSIIQ
jgi:hypothetical protein